jgi:ABC transport system ATP-binding/permease protein
MHKLIIEDDEGKTVVVPLIRDEITVGRQEGNTVRLTEQNISRSHARFVREGGMLYVEDVKSYNGIRVNGTLIVQKTALKDGDQILIGDYKLALKADETKNNLGIGSSRPRAQRETPAPAPAVSAPPAQSPSSAAPSDIIEGAPTIPVRTLADQGLLSGGPIVTPSRLVAMSTQLAGTEFVLDRASLVIGRTAENDIILNHKSISRHHAKVIRDGDKYIVVDLESANGVRVNGVQQERSVLDSGDVIEMGHVRLKYLTGDDVMGAAGIASLQGSKKPLYIGAAAVAGIGIVLFVALSGGSKDKPATTVETAPAEKTAAAPAAPATPPPVAAPAPAPAPAEAPVAAAPAVAAAPSLDSARQLALSGRWDEALAALEQLPPALSNGTDGKAVRKQIAVERAAEATLARLQVEADAGRLEPAKKLAQGIPADSRYATAATELITKVQTAFVQTHMKSAEGYKEAGRCDEARKEADRVLRAVPGTQSAIDLMAGCKPSAPSEPLVAAAVPKKADRALRPSDSEDPPGLPAPKAKAEPKEDEEPAATGDPDQFIKDAQESWLHGQFAAAILASRKALRLRPGMARAYQIISVCSCSLRDQASALKAYERLDDKNRQMVRSLCERNGITLPE